MITVKAYILEDSRKDELLMVIRTTDRELLRTIVKKLSKIRDKDIRAAAAVLEEDLNE